VEYRNSTIPFTARILGDLHAAHGIWEVISSSGSEVAAKLLLWAFSRILEDSSRSRNQIARAWVAKDRLGLLASPFPLPPSLPRFCTSPCSCVHSHHLVAPSCVPFSCAVICCKGEAPRLRSTVSLFLWSPWDYATSIGTPPNLDTKPDTNSYATSLNRCLQMASRAMRGFQ
jgi:hypothetical protein